MSPEVNPESSISGSTSKPHSWRFWMIIGYVLIVAVFCMVWLWSMFGPLENAVIDQQRESLITSAQAGVTSLEDSTRTPTEICDSLVENTDLRATIIADDGTVLGDSAGDASTYENHLDRPEVQSALSGEVGSDIRTSDTTNVRQLYVAVPATYRGQQAVMRVSAPLSAVNEVMANIRRYDLILLVVGLAVATLIAWKSYRGASMPVNKIERIRTEFVANASHELKTPVAGIRLLSEAIKSSADDGDLEKARMFASRLENEATRLQHLVTDLLDLNRLENRPDSKNIISDIHSTVTTSFEAHRRVAEEHGLEFELDDRVKPDERCYARLNATDATIIIDNLIDNAILYTEKGSITVTLDLEQHAQKMIVIQVKDTGIGIPDADQARVFERFYRVDTAHSREVGGTGLGLSLVRHAVHRAGGTIDVDSELGKGSTFTVRIPAVAN